MTYRIPTCSGLERALACPHSLTLPERATKQTDGMAYGNAAHKYLENLARRLAGHPNPPEALEGVPVEFHARLLALDTTPLAALIEGADEVRCEQAMALRGGRGEWLSLSGHRNYGDATEDTHLYGTADLIIRRDEDILVLDWKTGWQDLPAPENSAQLSGLALMAVMADPGVVTAKVAYGIVTDDALLIQEPVSPVPLLHLLGVVEDMRKDSAEPRPGSHCVGCKSFAFCKAQTALAASLGGGELEKTGKLIAVNLTPETASVAWDRLLLLKALCEEAESILKLYAESQPIPRPNGKELAAIEVTRETIDPDAAELILEPEIFHGAVEMKRSITKTDIKKAVDAYCKAHPVEGETKSRAKAMFEAAIEDLRAGEAMKETYFFKVTERKAGG